ncbi:MAG: hypothetical protein J3K34DRAFT_436552 [Monoraphidium minutum]|nr:MAG: hypothetical protein J3K34DRAFT_436552 [Monoraphidium minutum]
MLSQACFLILLCVARRPLPGCSTEQVPALCLSGVEHTRRAMPNGDPRFYLLQRVTMCHGWRRACAAPRVRRCVRAPPHAAPLAGHGAQPAAPAPASKRRQLAPAPIRQPPGGPRAASSCRALACPRGPGPPRSGSAGPLRSGAGPPQPRGVRKPGPSRRPRACVGTL